MEFKPECRRCHTAMKHGFLIDSPDVIEPDGTIRAGGSGGSFQSAPITVTECWKCPACGHSFVPGQPSKDPGTALILRFPAVHEFELAHTMNWQIHHDPNRFTRLEILASYLRVEAAISHPQFKEELLASYRCAIALRNSR